MTEKNVIENNGAETPKGGENVAAQIAAEVVVKASDIKEFKLPSGKLAIMTSFKGKHVREAQKMADGEPDKLIFAIIAITTTIDGQPVVMEDLDEMDGFDVFDLYGKFSSNFTSAPNK